MFDTFSRDLIFAIDSTSILSPCSHSSRVNLCFCVGNRANDTAITYQMVLFALEESPFLHHGPPLVALLYLRSRHGRDFETITYAIDICCGSKIERRLFACDGGARPPAWRIRIWTYRWFVTCFDQMEEPPGGR